MTQTTSAPAAIEYRSVEPPEDAPSSYRWMICALLFAGLTVNYVDRQILSLLKPTLDKELGWSNAEYGAINSVFQFAYSASLFFFGWFVDRFGAKVGYSVSIVAWSLGAAAHALVGSVSGFFAARISLGLGEGGSFPASIKTVAAWFPQRERAFATSLFNAGSNVGAFLAPALVPLVLAWKGWHACFLIAGAAGFVWLAFWLALYRHEPQPTTAALPIEPRGGGVESQLVDAPPAKPPLSRLLKQPQAWAFPVGKMLTDPVWWFFLTWLPDYFKSTRGMDLKQSQPHLVTIYVIVTALSIVGGFAPKALINAGYSPSAARKLTMLGAALCAVPIFFATSLGPWGAVVLIGLAGAAHQAWSANLYNIVADMYPKSVVGSLVGFGSMAGSLASIVFPLVVGFMLDHMNKTAAYSILFSICGCAYVVAFAVQHLFLARRFEPVPLEDVTANRGFEIGSR